MLGAIIFFIWLPFAFLTMLWRTFGTLARSVSRPIHVAKTIAKRQNVSAFAAPLVQQRAQLSQTLPPLPVQPLSDTLDKYLLCVRPLLSDDELKHAEQLVADLKRPEGQGMKIQTLLENRAKSMDNWLSEWWLNVAYLDSRIPVTINVSPGFTMRKDNYKGVEGQTLQAARIISGVLSYKHLLDRGELPVDLMGESPLCMKQFYWILATCRVPGAKRDHMINVQASEPGAPRHITVVHNNQFFSVNVYGSDDKALSVKQLQEQMSQVMNESAQPGLPLGVLTTDNRDNWYKTYTKLTKDKQNKKNLEDIHRSILVLCLDQDTSSSAFDPADMESVALQNCNHGLGSGKNSGNRWADKTLQLVVSPGGYWGMNYEHSTAEGVCVTNMLDYVSDYIVKKRYEEVAPATGLAMPQKLDFKISGDVEVAIQNSAQALDSLIDDLDLRSWHFNDYGKNYIKSQKISPDAFIQINMQLAFYRLYGHSTATYESGSLRKFNEGRTDVIRSCTVASHAFCQAMDDPDLTQAQKAKSLRDAIAAHRKYTAEVLEARGVDRHFLGLKLAAIEGGHNIPALLMDPVFEVGVYWRLSTSQVGSRSGGTMGYAPGVPDGYGICYNPLNDSLLFAISAWNSCPATSSAKYQNALRQSLMDSRTLLDTAQSQL